jgi:plastocyanin domain-containing protein
MNLRTRIASASVALACAALLAGCGTHAPSGPARHEITVGDDGFVPNRVEAQAGHEVVLVFKRVSDQTCATDVVIPSENRKVALPLNQPVEVRFTPKAKGEIPFSCGMNMYSGAVVVR